MITMERFLLFSFFTLIFSMLTITSDISLAQATQPEIQSADLSMSSRTSFRKQIDAALKECPTLHCKKNTIQAKTLTQSEMATLDKSSKQQLAQLCEDMAEAVWPDTILEGPYVASFQVQIKKMEALIKTSTGKQIGYRIIYADNAWDTDTCNYDPQDSATTLKDCKPGQLVESLFVSTVTNEAFRDPNGIVEFVPDTK